MKFNETLYVSDLDGTLLNDNQKLSDQTVSYLSEALKSGLNFTYATARSIASSRFVLESLGLDLPVILYNGAQIYCPLKKKYIHCSYMEPESYLSHMGDFLREGLEPVVHCMDYKDELRVYFSSVSNESTANWINSRLANGDSRFRITKDFSEVDPEKVIAIMVVDLKEKLSNYQRLLPAQSLVSYHFSEDIYCRGFYWLELAHINANKGHAVEFLKQHLSMENVISFGDNQNDLSMFQVSTKSLAVNNAKLNVRNAASDVIPSNNEHSVATYIWKIFKN